LRRFDLIALALLSAACQKPAVVTQRVDNTRRGAVLLETVLSPSSVSASSFGRLYERNLDGQTLANPLVMPDVALAGGKKTLFFMATAKNCLYAFDLNDTDPDGPAPSPSTACMWEDNQAPDLAFRDPTGHCQVSTKAIWTRDLGPSGCANVCQETWPRRVGVTATPAIDRSRGWMFVVSYHVDTRQNFIHKIDITNGNDLQPAVQIGGSTGGKTFNAACQRNRPGLLIQNDVVYVGFATFTCDADCANDPYHGWVFGFNESDLSPAGTYITSADGGGAGIWQSGNGLVGDGNTIFVMTGNEHPGTARADSFIRLHATGGAITEDAFFQVANHARLGAGDTDLGSSGPVLLPGNKILGGGKEGRLHLLDASLTGAEMDWLAFTNTWHNDSSKAQCDFSSWQNDPTNLPCFIPTDRYQDSEHWGPNIHNGPVYWESDADSGHGFVYLMPEKDFLKQYRYDLSALTMETTPHHTATERPPDGMPGAAISVSASLKTGGVVWTIVPNGDGQWRGPVGGHLVAFDANDLHILFRDDDQVSYAKFNPPIAIAGRVIRPTFANQVIVYGLLPVLPCGGGAVNACGGCNTLFAAPGGGCQDTATKKCGRWSCVNQGTGVTCDTSSGLTNPCGGCSLMALPLSGFGRGDSCQCPDATEAQGTLVCTADKNHLVCCPCSSGGGLNPACR
jgi:hypothetical protein